MSSLCHDLVHQEPEPDVQDVAAGKSTQKYSVFPDDELVGHIHIITTFPALAASHISISATGMLHT